MEQLSSFTAPHMLDQSSSSYRYSCSCTRASPAEYALAPSLVVLGAECTCTAACHTPPQNRKLDLELGLGMFSIRDLPTPGVSCAFNKTGCVHTVEIAHPDLTDVLRNFSRP